MSPSHSFLQQKEQQQTLVAQTELIEELEREVKSGKELNMEKQRLQEAGMKVGVIILVLH